MDFNNEVFGLIGGVRSLGRASRRVVSGNFISGLVTWLFTLDHKRIGLIYMVLGVWGGFIGLSLRFLIRLNYVDPYYNVVPAEVYKFVITSHGISMIFFFLMPVLIGGFGNYLLPLLLGLKDLRLPRLKALSA